MNVDDNIFAIKEIHHKCMDKKCRIRTNTLGRRRRTILLFLQRTRELVYVPRPCVGIYVQEISGGCFGSPLLTPAADTHEELD
jgi:hypothetical protein